MRYNNEELDKLSMNVKNLLSSKFINFQFNRKINNWYKLNVNEFFKEIEKQKIKLSLSDQSEWLQYFEEQKSKALAIKTQIEQTDKQIDKMVYELYELTEDEIKIVEGI
jgi:hypothetical protein